MFVSCSACWLNPSPLRTTSAWIILQWCGKCYCSCLFSNGGLCTSWPGHDALKFVLKLIDLTSKLSRCALSLSEFWFEVIYCAKVVGQPYDVILWLYSTGYDEMPNDDRVQVQHFIWTQDRNGCAYHMPCGKVSSYPKGFPLRHYLLERFNQHRRS